MEWPTWINPNNWSKETQDAAKVALKAVIVVVITAVCTNEKIAKEIIDSIKDLDV